MNKIHGNTKCGCGHRQKDHYLNEGFCHDSTHPRAGKCGCTWFYPSDSYIKKLQKMKEKHHRHLIDRMKGWLFVKSTDKKPRRRLTVASLGYRSDSTLEKISTLTVGDSIRIYDYDLTRVQ